MPTLSDLKACILPALFAVALFFAVLYLRLSSFFLFLPSLPLFYIGLGMRPRYALVASAMAGLFIALLGMPSLAVSFLLIIGLPAWYVCRMALITTPNMTLGQAQWYPVGNIITGLCVLACAFIAVTALYMATQPENLPTLIIKYIRIGLAPYKERFGGQLEMLAERWSFLSLALTLWIWNISLYAHAWLAQTLLIRKQRQIRPDFAVRPFIVPSWMFSLLGICALASLIGGQSSQFVGKALLMLLALPYFFSGAALLHVRSQPWVNRRFFLFIIYFVTLTQIWPALLLAGWGLAHQVKNLNKRLP